MVKMTFLVDNKTGEPCIGAEHGLSIYIEALGKKILFDAGATRTLFSDNAKRLGVDLSQVDFAAVSHGHYDHTNGFPLFIKQNSRAPIYIHKDSFEKVYGVEDGVIDQETCSIEWTESERKQLEDRLVLTDGPMWLCEDIVVTGTVPTADGKAAFGNFLVDKGNGEFVKDDILHEQLLVIRDRDEMGKSRGLFVFAGCCHRGAVEAVEYAKALFPGEEITCFVAGMHLAFCSEEVRTSVIEKIIDLQPKLLIPVHCTGIDAIIRLKILLGDRCIVATAGDTYEL